MGDRPSVPGLYCWSITTFHDSGELDESAFRQHLERLVAAGVGVFLGSGGSGEGNALADDELARVYQVGVEVCKGRVPVSANPPEASTIQSTLDHIRLAIKAGVERVSIYGPLALHGFRPTAAEYLRFIDQILGVIRHPVILALNPLVGYEPAPATVAALCKRYPQIEVVNLVGQTDSYLVALQDQLERQVVLNVPLTGSMNALALGASGILGTEMNLIPKSYQRYLDLWHAGDVKGSAAAYTDLKRFGSYVQSAPRHPRWIKMALRAFKIPGGGLRSPYLMSVEDEVKAFAAGLLALNLPELNEMARTAGFDTPA